MVTLGFEHVKLVSKPGPEEWQRSALLTAPPLTARRSVNIQGANSNVEVSTGTARGCAGLRFAVRLHHPDIAITWGPWLEPGKTILLGPRFLAWLGEPKAETHLNPNIHMTCWELTLITVAQAPVTCKGSCWW